MLVHRKQFIIDTVPHQITSEWLTTQLQDPYVLSYHTDLTVSSVRLDGRSILVLGERLPLSQPMDVEDTIFQSSGRFAVIDWPHLLQDTCGQLGIYFYRSGHRTLCTSSPALAAEILELPVRDQQFEWPSPINYFLSPGSRVLGLKRLIPDQTLNIADGQLSAREHQPFKHLDAIEDPVDSLGRALTRVIQEASELYDTIYLPLTAGRDSRTLFAALLQTRADFTAVTQTIGSGPGDTADIEVATKLCKQYKIRHEVISPLEASHQISLAIPKHTLRSVENAGSAILIPTRQYDFLADDDVLLKGGIFEVGRRFFEHMFASLPSDFSSNGRALWDCIMPRSIDVDQIESLEEWRLWRDEHDYGLDLTDSFYIDQDAGAWSAAIEQQLDALPGTSINPVNCAPALRALLTGDVDVRRKALVQFEMIRRVDPGLLDIPFNPKSLRYRAKRLARRLMARATA